MQGKHLTMPLLWAAAQLLVTRFYPVDEFSFKEMRTWGIITLYLCLVWIRGNRRKVEFKIPLCNTVAEIFSLDRVALKILSNINDRVPLWKQPTALRCWLFPQKGSTTDLQLDCKCGSDWRCCECGMWVDCQYMEFIASTWCSTK